MKCAENVIIPRAMPLTTAGCVLYIFVSDDILAMYYGSFSKFLQFFINLPPKTHSWAVWKRSDMK